MKVDGKGAVVTGGSQGLGKAFSKILLQNGAKVLFTDVNEETGQATLTEFQKTYGQNSVRFIKADVTSVEEMKEAFQMIKAWLGRLDILINNAGIGGEGGDLWQKCVDINLKGPINCSMHAMELMRKSNGGQGGVIINIASAGGLKPQPFGPVYSATKAGLIMYTRSLAVNPDFQDNGIRVCSLCPAFADTAMVANISTTSTFGDKALAFVRQVGVMTVDYVAEGLYELVTDDSKNGDALIMSKLQGKSYVAFPS